MARLSYHRFRYEVRLWLRLTTCNLANLCLGLALKRINDLSLTSLQQWLVKERWRLARHAR